VTETIEENTFLLKKDSSEDPTNISQKKERILDRRRNRLGLMVGLILIGSITAIAIALGCVLLACY
jgi:hypothetical protein